MICNLISKTIMFKIKVEINNNVAFCIFIAQSGSFIVRSRLRIPRHGSHRDDDPLSKTELRTWRIGLVMLWYFTGYRLGTVLV